MTICGHVINGNCVGILTEALPIALWSCRWFPGGRLVSGLEAILEHPVGIGILIAVPSEQNQISRQRCEERRSGEPKNW